MNATRYIARSSDENIQERGESGGVVTSVLKCALENGDIDPSQNQANRDVTTQNDEEELSFSFYCN